MAEKGYYITVVNGLGEKAEIPRHRLEEYKKLMAEFMEMDKKVRGTSEPSKVYQIKEIIE